MISIVEMKSEKVVGSTSLCVLSDYDQKVIDVIKSTGCAVWHKRKKFWEVPCYKLAYLIDNLCYLDDIDLSFMQDAEICQIEPIADYKTKPFPYQEQGIKWLINNPNGLLLDEPGLGKTLQIIYAAEELKIQKNIEHCLIICGINMLKENWAKEIEKHSSLDCRVIGRRINSKGRVTSAPLQGRADELHEKIDEFFIIINIESLRDDLVIEAMKSSVNNFDMIVFDEVHKVKDSNSIQGKNLLKISSLGKYHYGLTGTIIVNSPFDAYVPLRFIQKENACMSTFKNYYCDFERIFDYRLGKYRNNLTGYKNLDSLKEEIESCSLRRRKNILDLPPKTVIDEYIEMSPEHQKFYFDLSKGVTEEADRVSIKDTSLLGLTVRLRQAATCPSILTSAKIKETKIERACELAEEIMSNGDKVVIFCSFKDPIKKIASMLSKYNPLIGTGDLDDKTVSDNIDIFQNDPSRKLFIGTQQKMSTGVTLTAASYMILLDSPWTQSDFDQETDRIHRIGSDNPVIIYNLISAGTIDERVKILREYKKSISDYLVDGEANAMTASSKSDYLYLLGLKSIS